MEITRGFDGRGVLGGDGSGGRAARGRVASFGLGEVEGGDERSRGGAVGGERARERRAGGQDDRGVTHGDACGEPLAAGRRGGAPRRERGRDRVAARGARAGGGGGEEPRDEAQSGALSRRARRPALRTRRVRRARGGDDALQEGVHDRVHDRAVRGRTRRVGQERDERVEGRRERRGRDRARRGRGGARIPASPRAALHRAAKSLRVRVQELAEGGAERRQAPRSGRLLHGDPRRRARAARCGHDARRREISRPRRVVVTKRSRDPADDLV